MKRALVISLICVLGLAFTGLAATLSGSWDTDVTIDPQQTNFDDAIGLVSVLTVIYTVGDWSFTSVTDLDESGWTDQDFSVAGVLGAFVITSALDFDVTVPAFGSWNTTADVSIAGVSFGFDFTLYPNDVELVLSAGGVAGDVTVDVEVTFGDLIYTALIAGNGCDLDWAGITIDIGFPFDCALIDLAIEFDCDGFVDAVFTTTGIAIPNLPWVTLDVELSYTVQTKSLTITPAFDFGTIVCFDLYIDVAESGNLTLGAITFEGIGLSVDFGGVIFTGTSFWGTGTKPGLLYGTSYWEVYSISTTDDACCGPFDFDVAVYFLDGGVALFDVALIDVDVELEIASQFTFTMGLEVDVDLGFSEWTVGFEVTW